MAKLLIHRKGFSRRRRGRIESVTPTQFLAKDRGKKGRGEKVIPELKEGTLGEGFTKLPAPERRAILAKIARKEGEAVSAGKVQALSIFAKRTDRRLSQKMAADASWVHSAFEGKKQVRRI